MSTAMTRVRRKAGAGAFFIGMSLIGASVVLNIAYDRLPGVGAEALPKFLSHMYETSGKNGVTIAFVVLGLGVMLFGFALPKSESEKIAEAEERIRAMQRRAAATEPPPQPSTDGANEPTTTPDGQIILRTQQYLRKKSGP